VLLAEAARLLDRLRPDTSKLPKPLLLREKAPHHVAKSLWFEAAVRGHPLAQVSLGQLIMEDEEEKKKAAKKDGDSNADAIAEGCDDPVTLAATLFALASQQVNEMALEGLIQVVRFDAERRKVHNEEQFAQIPTMQIATAACGSLPVGADPSAGEGGSDGSS
jgi:hypothetical protein